MVAATARPNRKALRGSARARGAGAAVVADRTTRRLFAGAELCGVDLSGRAEFPALAPFEADGARGDRRISSWRRAASMRPSPWSAGTNGKSTTTALRLRAAAHHAGASPSWAATSARRWSRTSAPGTATWSVSLQLPGGDACTHPCKPAPHALIQTSTPPNTSIATRRCRRTPRQGPPLSCAWAPRCGRGARRRPLCAAEARRGQARLVTFSTPPGDGAAPADVRAHGDRMDGRRAGLVLAAGRGGLTGRHTLARLRRGATACAVGAHPEAIACRHWVIRGAGAPTTALVAEVAASVLRRSKGTNVGASVAALRGLAEPRAVPSPAAAATSSAPTIRWSTALRGARARAGAHRRGRRRIAAAAADVLPSPARRR